MLQDCFPCTKVNYNKDHLEGEKVLQIAIATRWNSQLKMLRSIVAVPPDKLDSLDTQKQTAYERNVIKEIIEVLAPLKKLLIVHKLKTILLL